MNWDKWQTYRKDRGTPPWIKVYRNLMSNEEWASLSDAEKGQLVSLWILGSDRNGLIPENSTVLRRMCMLDSDPNIIKFIELGFLSRACQPDGNQLVTIFPQIDAPETETETETETEEPIIKAPAKIAVPYHDIINIFHDELNELSSVAKLTSSRKAKIKQRWKNDFPDLDLWRRYFVIVRGSQFLMGKVPGRNGAKPFQATFDWLINESNAVKIIEGNYHE